MVEGLKKLPITVALIALVLAPATATDLQNIQSVTPQGSQDIYINGTLNLQSNPLLTDTTLDGIDLDNPGNALTINSNQYEVASNSIYQDELNTGNVDNRYLNRGGDTMTGNLDLNGNDLYYSGSGDPLTQRGTLNPEANPIQGWRFEGEEGTTPEGWTVNSNSFSIETSSTTTESPGGFHSDKSARLGGGGNAGAASVYPNMDGTVTVSWNYYETTNVCSNSLRAYDENDNQMIEIGSDNPQWDITDASGTEDIYSSSSYQDWHYIELKLDTNEGNYTTYWTNTETGHVETHSGNLQTNGNTVKRLEFSNSCDDEGWIDNVNVMQAGSDTSQYLSRSGSSGVNGQPMVGNINMDSNAITNLQDPSNAQDAATKSYVDSNTEANTDSQDLSNNLDTSPGVGYVEHDIQISGGSNTVARDYYESNTDNQGLPDVLNNDNSANQNVNMNDNSITNLNDIQLNGDSGTNVYSLGEGGLETNAFTMRGDNRDLYIYSASTTSGDNIHLTTQDGGGTALDRIEIGTGSSTTDVDIRNANLDLNTNQLKNVGSTDCSSNEFIDGDGNCISADTSSSNELQNLGEVLNQGNTANQPIDMNNEEIRNLNAINHSGTGIDIVWQGGENDIEFQHYTNPGTDFLRIDYDNNDIVTPNANLDISGNNILNGAICPDGNCGKSNYETFDSSGIGTTNIYSGSGGEIDIQSTINFNSNNVKNFDFGSGSDLDASGNVVSFDNANDLDGSGDINSGAAGSYLSESGGSLDVSDNWVDESGDSMSGDLDMSNNDLWISKGDGFGLGRNDNICPDNDCFFLAKTDSNAGSDPDGSLYLGNMNMSDETDFDRALSWDAQENVQIPNGQLQMGSNRITNVQDPSNAQDAATKSYVDNNDDTADGDTDSTNELQNLGEVLNQGNTANQDINMNGNQLNNVNNISSENGVVQPSLVLHSSSNNDQWNEQGSYISIGESGALGSASMHMTYRGDGTGYLGAGSVSNAVPDGSYFEFNYNSADIKTNSNVDLNSNKIYDANYIELNNIESVSDGQIGRDNSIGYLGNWGGNGNAVLWDAYNVQTNGGISISGGTGNEDNPQINLAANDLDSSGNINDFSAANDLDSNGNINDWSGANDLDSSGDVNSGAAGSYLSVSSGSLDVNAGSVLGSGNDLDSNGDVVASNVDLENSGSDIISINRVSGTSEHTIRFDDEDLRFWSGDGGGTVIRMKNESGNVEIPNGDLNVGGQLSASSTNCGSNEFIDGDGNCVADSFESNTDSQDLSNNLDTSPGVGYVEHDIQISGGSDTVARDYYEANTDNQGLPDVLNNDNSANQNINVNGNDLTNVRRIDGNSGNHRIRFDSSSSWLEFTDQSNNRQDVVTQDVYINDKNLWLGDDTIATIAGNNVGLGGSTSINHGDLSSISYNDHHGVGDDITWDGSNNIALQDNIDVSSISSLTATNALVFDGGDHRITNHDGNGNFNIKAGVDDNNNIVSGGGGSHIQISDGGIIRIQTDTSTSSGSNFSTDANLQVDSDVNVRSAPLDLNGNNINNIGGLQGCGNNQYVGGDGNCKNDNTGTDDQTLGEVLNQGNTATQNIDMNGNNITNYGNDFVEQTQYGNDGPNSIAGDVIWEHNFTANGIPSEFKRGAGWNDTGTWGCEYDSNNNGCDGDELSTTGVFEPTSMEGDYMRVNAQSPSSKAIAFPTNVNEGLSNWQLHYRVDPEVKSSDDHSNRDTAGIYIDGEFEKNVRDTLNEQRVVWQDEGSTLEVKGHSDNAIVSSNMNVSSEYYVKIQSLPGKTRVKYWEVGSSEPSSWQHEVDVDVSGRPGLMAASGYDVDRWNDYTFYELREIQGDPVRKGYEGTLRTKGNIYSESNIYAEGLVHVKGADLAEIYKSSQSLEEGEVVAISSSEDDKVVRTNSKFQETVTGIVSTDPGNVLNSQNGIGYPIALEGKVPVKVEEGLSINRGDRIIPSSEEGKATTCETINPVENEKMELREIISHNQKCEESTIARSLEKAEDKDKILVKLE